MKPFLALREAVHPLFQQSGLGMHPCLLPVRTLALTLEPWVSQTKITAAILCRQVKAAELQLAILIQEVKTMRRKGMIGYSCNQD